MTACDVAAVPTSLPSHELTCEGAGGVCMRDVDISSLTSRMLTFCFVQNHCKHNKKIFLAHSLNLPPLYATGNSQNQNYCQ